MRPWSTKETHIFASTASSSTTRERLERHEILQLFRKGCRKHEENRWCQCRVQCRTPQFIHPQIECSVAHFRPLIFYVQNNFENVWVSTYEIVPEQQWQHFIRHNTAAFDPCHHKCISLKLSQLQTVQQINILDFSLAFFSFFSLFCFFLQQHSAVSEWV